MIPSWLRTTTPPEHESLSKSLPSTLHVINMCEPATNRGRPRSKVTPEVGERMRALDKTMTRVAIAKILNITPSTVRRFLGWKHAAKRTKLGRGNS